MAAEESKIESIFYAAIDRESAAERAAYLDEACGGDGELRGRVELLLEAQVKLGRFLESDREEGDPTLEQPPIEKLGTYIDRYKLVHEIGHGGMGVVYMAVQKEPVKRKVALKIIKPGMDTREVVSRFEAERQALALMDHQCIATVLDGGSTQSGRPYFVMELVDGTPITEYCDECRFTTRQRMQLFVQVCHAVQHAHQKGVIHRDIKPSNVLVTNYDHLAVPKVIDFGIAKAVNQQLTDQSLYTNIAQMIGTPLYMSPEQAQRSGLDVDTRTDVYSLGVLLYELLTGTTPFDKERLKNSSLDEVKRIIREEEPPRPSTRLATLDAALETVADKHHTDARTLSHEVAGELDWIVIKSLEKDRTRRYESANDLAKDVQRYLDDDPVEACPPTTVYRLRKFARRNKTVVSMVSIVVLTLAVGLAGTAWQAIRATKAEGLAGERLTEVDEQRKLAARNYVQAREAVKQMLTRVADEELAKIPEMKEVRHRLLEDAAAFYTELLKLNPRDAQAYFERAHVYDLLTQFDRALVDYQKAVSLDPHNAIFRRTLGHFWAECPDIKYRDRHRALLHEKRAVELDPLNSDCHFQLADTYEQLGFPQEAKAALQQAVQLDPDSALFWANAAGLCQRLGDRTSALSYARKAIELDPTNAGGHFVMGWLLAKWGDDEKAIPYIDEAIRIRPNPKFYFYDNRGDIYSRLGKHAAAIEDYSKSLDLAPFRSFTYKRRALAHFNLKNYEQALADIAKAVELLPEDMSSLTWIPLQDVAKCPDESFRKGILELADKVVELNEGASNAQVARIKVYAALGHEEEAFDDLEATIAKQRDLVVEFPNVTAHRERLAELQSALAHAFSSRARLLLDEGKIDEAIGDCTKAIRSDPGDTTAYRFRADAYRKQDEVEKAIADYSEAIRCDTKDAHSLANLAALLANCKDVRLRDYKRAVELARQTVTLSPQNAFGQWVLGSAEYRSGDWEAARKTLEHSLNLKTRGWGPERWIFLAMTYWQLGKRTEAQSWYRRFVEHVKTNKPDDKELLRLLAEAERLMGPINVEPMEETEQGEPGEDMN